MACAHRSLGASGTVAVVLGAVMSGCASSPAPPPPGAAPPAAAGSRTAAYDWRALVLVPFGTLFKDMPLALTEVLTFHDSAEPRRADEDRDCYTTQGVAPPNLLGHRPDEYLLCFDHDRLSRIHASASMPAADAAFLLAAACAEWQRGAAGASSAADRCAGRDGDTDFSARLSAGEPPSIDTVSLTLSERPP